MKKYVNYINGEFVPPINDKYLQVINPATEEIISEVPDSSPEDVNMAIKAAYNAKKEWRRLPPKEIASYIRKLSELIKQNKDLLARTITEEEGKTYSSSVWDVMGCVSYMEFAAEWARRLEGDILPSDIPGGNVLIYKQPRGVVACIVPWNLPLGTIGRKIGPALIAGNTVIIKPSSNTPNNAFEFARLVQEAKIPPGVINVISGRGSLIGKELARNPKVNFITLTGSLETGQEVIKNSAENLTRVSLELGGKTPAIVMDDADIELAVRCIMRSRFWDAAGQVCVGMDRVYIHEKIVGELTEKLVREVKKIRVGDPMDPASGMGSMVSKDALTRVSQMVDKAVSEGAKVLSGGQRCENFKKGFFYEPTLLAECRQEQEIMHKEIFGPVITITSFKTLDEAIEMANDCEYGLASAIYTKDINNIKIAINELEFGETFVNRPTSPEIQGFHNGWKKSGIGGDDGKYGIAEYQQVHVTYL